MMQLAGQDTDCPHHRSLYRGHPDMYVHNAIPDAYLSKQTHGTVVDNRIARATEILIELVVYMLLKMSAIILFSPIFIIPAIMVAVAGGVCGNVFMKVQLSVKREMSNSKAPVLSDFGAAIGGISEYSFSKMNWFWRH